MYGVVQIKGHQYKVQAGDIIDVDKLSAAVDEVVDFDQVLFTGGSSPRIGAPTVDGAKVVAKVVRQARDRKIIVLKRKPGKYVKKNGHRTHYTGLLITEIHNGAGEVTKSDRKVSTKKKEAPKKEAKKATPKKKVEAKKPAAKKTETKKAPAKAAAVAATVDDLTKVEGIGPKIAGILNESGIYTWAELGDTKVQVLRDILEAAGPRYKSKNPGSWAKQARMAAKGDWDKLKAWQDEHDHGIEKK